MNKYKWIVITISVFLLYQLIISISSANARKDYYEACTGLADSHFSSGKINAKEYQQEIAQCLIFTNNVYGNK